MTDAPPLPFAVVASAEWTVHWGGINNAGGIAGRLTKCRTADGLVFYVRENQAVAHFNVSAGERQAMKRGEVRGRQVLELCCAPALWEKLAAVVAAADALGRPVRRNRRFTPGWAERCLKNPGMQG
jgi:hypothetical protein